MKKLNQKYEGYTKMYNTGLIAFSLLLAMVSACGNKEQNPTKGYEILNTAVVPEPIATAPQTTKRPLFYIHANDDLTFVQGEKRKVVFTTSLAFADLPHVKYSLSLKEGPVDLGAKFYRESPNANTWVLLWQPSRNILNSTENFKKFNLIINFVLEPGSSAAVKSEFAGYASETMYVLTLQKNFSQPVIEDKIEISPSATLTSDQTARIRFIVAADALDRQGSLVVNLNSGPREVASELAQFDGLEGVRGVKPVFKSLLGQDSSGRNRYQYEIIFKAKPFLEYALLEMKSQPNLKRRLENKEIKSIEAVFSIEAVNSYSHVASAQKNINLAVALPEATPPTETPANKEVPK